MLYRLASLLAFITLLPMQAQAKTITVSGSTSVSHVLEVLAETYQTQHPDTQIAVQGTGSSAGIAAVKQNASELGMSSRFLEDDEIRPDVESTIIAHDGIALVVNKANPVNTLTKAQVIAIYQGKITNWKEVGGPDLPIAVVSRENASGSRFSFEDFMGLTRNIGDKKVSDINAKVLVVNTNGMVKSLIARNRHALGYLSLGSLDDSVKALSYEGITPTLTHLESGEYQISRPFIMLYKNAKITSEGRDFLDFVLSKEGQSLLHERGYIPVRH
ncbi:phosphate ABC transporter substrate-binding protein [Photobacterium galatheae]|uniref:Phosphate-binding protein n=1 Tax=Photobacterium galatheae TaxID=1654360 RepID=A0A066RHJ5_9GAMM|nr:phosphate ABC transporter substrate-binding protein [Photobacterium galatheae]KDM89930.1 phosphate ABC transporter substrate-binding protein [Photobacterium galatheae]MCM0149767.1 phosphate ABC transporter substrate-binding protein [Photobacterium galatheae]